MPQFPDEFGQMRDLSKDGRVRVERISSLFLPFVPFEHWQWSGPSITTAPAGHPPPWLQLSLGSGNNTLPLAF